MAGEARTTDFALGTATVMIGPQSKLLDLNVTNDSIGLVKNFTLTSEVGFTDLTQGTRNTVVYSVKTSDTLNASMEVYEMTGKNLTYGLGLDGSAISAQSANTTIAANTTANSNAIQLTANAGFTANSWVMISPSNKGADDVIVRRIANLTGSNATLSANIVDVVPMGSKIKVVNNIAIGGWQEPPFLAAKIAGTLADGSIVTVLLPKIKITKGFTMAFNSENYGNLPYEFSVFDLVPTDPFYAEFGGGTELQRKASLLTDN